MINLNINESKKLKFKISLSGIQAQDLKGAMRIMVDDIEYGFPIKIEEGNVVSEIPSLSSLVNNLKDGSVLNSKLEIIAGDTYLVPWTDNIKIENPVKVEAKIEDIDEMINEIIPKIKISSVSEEKEKKTKKIEEKEKKNKIKSRFSIMLEEPKCPEGEKW